MTKMISFEEEEFKLSSKQVKVLHDAVVNRESYVIGLRSAERFYSSKANAKSSMKRMQEKNVLERDDNGSWKIVRLPHSLKSTWREARA